ncbi:putative Late embryogenesis abundant protein, LEA-14 [Medicago truncatula]|uniref:Late embryogenesis abundant protein n=1 Tax=Medicago truncatula TaxID=3880 RepID=A0A072UA81_MEDTR|nr:NDR1/HIN1-like protein 10 [Medicago truncatula]KEH26689.1 late embryogenesis abundant protein [Medicago truncatula]RHN52271.1 putative Late embryogenesis abundant protein, LEA-14 [Medicago truncatula]
MGCDNWATRICCGFCMAVVLFVIGIIVFWIVISPSSVKFHVTDASLTEFNLTNNNLFYNFKVNITARNPNNNIIVYYRRITAIAWYKDNDFSRASLSPFDQGHKNTTFLGPVEFKGNATIKLGRQQLNEYSEETRLGIYNDLAVDFDFRIRAKFGSFYKSGRFKPPVVQCGRLSVPLVSSSNGNSSSSTFSFSTRRCSADSFFLDRDINKY